MAEKSIRYRSIVQCPYCGFKVTEKMPMQRKVMEYTCPACGKKTTAREDECCIFCKLGNVPCPEKQRLGV